MPGARSPRLGRSRSLRFMDELRHGGVELGGGTLRDRLGDVREERTGAQPLLVGELVNLLRGVSADANHHGFQDRFEGLHGRENGKSRVPCRARRQRRT